jgi:hypothetical protein
MKITEGQLRRLIRQEVTRLIEGAGALAPGDLIDTAEKFVKLNPGDRITVDDGVRVARAAVIQYEPPILRYSLEESGEEDELDTSWALRDEDLDEEPLVQVRLQSPSTSRERRGAYRGGRPVLFPPWLD